MDLVFNVTADWSGVGNAGQGTMHMGTDEYVYSAPANMGGKGVGASPEEFLIAAVTACYSGTLMRVLRQRKLPADSLTIQTAGIVEDFPAKTRFARITVNPVIKGGVPSQRDEYQKAADEARNQCFIGKTVRDYLQYEVGTVTIASNG
ncbi:OsmC family protein [Sulfobacillus harzensis]|uniref:Osmotically inducible protein OsmC n=1 Tax=Sulfobacillus harzensis TaxID=2729629 RepID=A0A7Y0L4Q5_9FIRM|nr:OsmC family protein [Sulfobacillus harzensis]NMP23256.1 hypothetical protein [Sulfobacillus harzensis]